MQSSLLAVWKNAGEMFQERGERNFAVGHEKVPHGFRLRTGDPGNTVDGAGNLRRPVLFLDQ